MRFACTKCFPSSLPSPENYLKEKSTQPCLHRAQVLFLDTYNSTKGFLLIFFFKQLNSFFILLKVNPNVELRIKL